MIRLSCEILCVSFGCENYSFQVSKATDVVALESKFNCTVILYEVWPIESEGVIADKRHVNRNKMLLFNRASYSIQGGKGQNRTKFYGFLVGRSFRL